MLNFRGDGQEQEEMRQLFNGLQSTLGTNSQQLLERLQIVLDVVNALDNAQLNLLDKTQENARQIVSLNSSFTTSFNELGKYLEESVNNLRERSEKLEARLSEQEKRAEAQSQITLERLRILETTLLERLEHLDDWKRTLPPDESAGEAAWLDHIKTDLRRLGHSEQLRGNAHLFAVQLAKHLRALQKLSIEIATRDTAHFTEKTMVQELDRTLFRPHFGVQWIDIGEDEYGGAGLKSRARAELRALETAILNYRRRLQQQLKQRHDFAPIHIVPYQTIFDPALHETTEMYSMPTSERDKDNRILGVERNGYQCGGEVLERAFVRRFLWDESAPVEESSAEENENVEVAETVAADKDDLSEEERERRLDEAMKL